MNYKAFFYVAGILETLKEYIVLECLLSPKLQLYVNASQGPQF